MLRPDPLFDVWIALALDLRRFYALLNSKLPYIDHLDVDFDINFNLNLFAGETGSNFMLIKKC